MHAFRSAFLALAVAGAALPALAQTPPPQNVAQLSASGSVEVMQDLLSIQMSTSREGADPAAVQGQLKQALDAALAEAKKAAQAGQMDVRTGNFSLNPRYGRDGKMSGWAGTAELVLEGKDFTRITQTAGRIQTLTMNGVNFGLSREARQQVEASVQSEAIERFKARAAEISRNFGFTGFTLREVNVSSTSDAGVPRPRMMMAMAKADAPAVPVEAGKTTVSVEVSGSVQMTR